uniref:Ig-like domain-containing protein n=1 Tax=Cyanoderma ruficeps TaxID=181631 RepID=A0A8C3XFW7_9PASS
WAWGQGRVLLAGSSPGLQTPPAAVWKPVVLAGGLGGSVTHQCFYSPTAANRHGRKFWCKVATDGRCYTVVSSSSPPPAEYRGRVALGDAPHDGTFRVTMTGLRSSDSGTYRCGIGSTNQGLYVSLNLTVSAGTRNPVPPAGNTGLEILGKGTGGMPEQTGFWRSKGNNRWSFRV